MRRDFTRAWLVCIALFAMPLSADVTMRTAISQGLANTLYCQLAGCTMTGTELLPNGTSAAPSQSFANFPTLGLYVNGTNFALAQGTGSLLVTGTTDVPTALTTALVVTAGNIDAGSHSYKVTYVTAGGETSGGTTSNAVVNDVTHAQNTLTVVPTGNNYVTQRKIYRNKVADQTHWFLQQTIADNTTTTGVQDNTADSSLTTAMPTTNTAIDTRWTMANTGAVTMTGNLSVSMTTPVVKVNDTSGTNAGFITNIGDGVAISVNKNTVSGTFTDAAKTHAAITLNGTAANSNINFKTTAANNTTATTALTIDKAQNVCWGTSADACIAWRATNILQLGQADSATPSAQTIGFQGSRGGTDSNVAGTASALQSSLGTGNAAGAQVSVSRALMGASGTTQQTAAHAVTVCESKTLSNTSATTTTIATIGLASNAAGGMHALITVTATDGTNFDSETQDVTVSYVNKATVITVGTPLISTSTAANNSGSATIGATVTGASPTVSLKVTPVFTTIVPTTVTVYAEIFSHGAGAVACQ